MMDLEGYDLDPALLQAKSKKPKQKRVRERDVERARAHKAQRSASEELVTDRKSTRLTPVTFKSRMPSSA